MKTKTRKINYHAILLLSVGAALWGGSLAAARLIDPTTRSSMEGQVSQLQRDLKDTKDPRQRTMKTASLTSLKEALHKDYLNRLSLRQAQDDRKNFRIVVDALKERLKTAQLARQPGAPDDPIIDVLTKQLTKQSALLATFESTIKELDPNNDYPATPSTPTDKNNTIEEDLDLTKTSSETKEARDGVVGQGVNYHVLSATDYHIISATLAPFRVA